MHLTPFSGTLLLAAFSLSLAAAPAGRAAEPPTLRLNLRSRVYDAKESRGPKDPGATFTVVEKPADWDARRTAVIIVDMWDDHWCKGAAGRVAELAGPMNEMLKAARARGVFVIHSPSSVTAFYKDAPQRRLARAAPFAPTPVPLAGDDRWGTKWCWPDKAREPDLPIDDSDMGCDCDTRCKVRDAWTRQTPGIEIADGDAITDDGQEAWNLLQSRGIDNVILCGVHLNMCVLGRPVGIRQMVRLGKNVALMRDMTDTMYNHEMRPGVDHFTGTDRVVEHVEKFWCPSFTSADLTGGRPFRFKQDGRKPDAGKPGAETPGVEKPGAEKPSAGR